MIIRPLERRDLPHLVDLCREHAEYERAPWAERDREPGLRTLLLKSYGTRCWVAEDAAGLAGFASASLELSTWDAGRYMHLDCLFVREPFRGRGLGRALVERVAQEALDLGAVNLQWQTPQWNRDAVRFYERLGATHQPKLRFTLTPDACSELLEPR